MKHTLHNKIIVSTDLDGTLLDHFTYDWRAALPSLKLLSEKQIPIVINTSKTYAEVKQLQTELGIDAAFVVENGSAIYVSKTSSLAKYFEHADDRFNRRILGANRQPIIDALHSIRSKHQFNFESYADWDTQELIKHTGLSESNAQLSLSREFSEPMIWHDTQDNFDVFCNEIKQHNLNLIKGGRFIHVLGHCNKGRALGELQSILYPNQLSSLICLGDSHNDLDMLHIADIPIFVRSPVHGFPAHNCQHPPIFTEGFGPLGWNEAIQSIFKP